MWQLTPELQAATSENDPIAIIVLYCLIVSCSFLAFPIIDLWVRRLRPFPLRSSATAAKSRRLLRASGGWAMEIVIVVLLLSLVGKIASPSRRSLGRARALSLFLLSTLIVAAGLLVTLS